MTTHNTDADSAESPHAADQPADERMLRSRVTPAVLVTLSATLAVALLLVAIETTWGPLHRLDTSVATNLHTTAVDHPLWTRTQLVVSDVGAPTVMRSVVGLLAVVLWIRGARRLALWAATTMIAGAVLDVVLKTVVGRARPNLPHPVATAGGGAFPSGHALTATIGAGVLVLWALPLVPRPWRIAVWAFGALVPLAVGFSRFALGVHWISDVVGAWLLGIGLVAATTAAFGAWPRERGRV